jgi:hypothetical protein
VPHFALGTVEHRLAAFFDQLILEVDAVARLGLAFAPRLAHNVEIAVAVDVADARVVAA